MPDAGIIKRDGQMPAPFARIRVSVEIRVWWDDVVSITVSYTARPSDLTAAGLVDSYMIERMSALRGGGPKSDANRRRFSLCPAVRPRRYLTGDAAWHAGVEVTLSRYPRTDEEALDLPGVRALLPDGLGEQAIENLPRVTESSPPQPAEPQQPAAASAPSTTTRRTRTVGRYQRAVEWTVVDSVLIKPDWEAIRDAAAR